MDDKILKPLQTMYHQLRRAWKYGKDTVGKEWKATNGMLQGCGLSVILLNVLVAIWSQAVTQEAQPEDEVRPRAYADDTGGTAKTVEGVQHIANISAEYAKLTKQKLHKSKHSHRIDAQMS